MLSPDELTELLAISRDSMEVDICERIEAHIREQAEALRKANEALAHARTETLKLIDCNRENTPQAIMNLHRFLTEALNICSAPTNPSEGETR